ncbi:MAG: hypothetical protein ACYC6Y_17120, partial [Thermoguttaceae bacterium]
MTRYGLVTFTLVAATILGGLFNSFAREPAPMAGSRQAAQKAYDNRNYKDAYELFSRLALDPAASEPAQVVGDLNMAIACLQQLNRTPEIDGFREAVAEAQSKNWRALLAVAQSYLNVDHQGFMIAGVFERGQHRGGGEVVNAVERDRVRAMQLMVRALPMALEDDNRREVGDFLVQFAGILLNNRGYGEAWRLQYLTDLAVLPDYDQGWGHGGNASAAPVDAEGNPVFHQVPRTFEASETDGQRWRWCLETAMEIAPDRRN